ncbi:MAG: hypothetical protein IJH71_06980 [Eubacterium sp.]|nr:hypothetical protein [Eubacterium sp.]
MKKLTGASGNWDCPAVDNRMVLPLRDRKSLSAMEEPEKLKKLVDKTAKESGNARYILPVRQNLEALAFARELGGEEWKPGVYCVKALEDIADFEFNLMPSPLIRAHLDIIPCYRDKFLILEAEAPFSILAALMNPMDLYLCFEESPALLEDILVRIAAASAEYIKACVEAGCRIISLADPVGTMDLVGEDYYRRFCGKAALVFMEKCEPYLDKAIMHLCMKMSRSLVISGMAGAEAWQVRDEAADYRDILLAMAEDERIHFTGMTCIHNTGPDLKMSCRILPGGDKDE